MSSKSNGPKIRCRNSPARPLSGAARISAASAAGGTRVISSAALRVATIRAPRTSWLPNVWSPLACVLTSVSIAAPGGRTRP